MGKLLSRFLIVLLVAAVASYVGMHWRVSRAVDNAFNQVRPFADVNHAGVSIAMDGRISVNDISVYMPSVGISFDIDSVGFSTSGLIETLRLEERLKQSQLPKEARVDIVDLRFALSPSLLKMTDGGGARDRLMQLSFLGCGNASHSTLRLLNDMGYNALVGNIELGYRFDEVTGDLTTSFIASANDLMRMEIVGLKKDARALMTDFRNFNALTAGEAADGESGKVTTKISDLGYNDRFASYCAGQAEMEKSAWLRKHTDLFMAALERFDIDVNKELKHAYPETLAPDAQLVIVMQPREGVNFGDMGWYESTDVPNLLGLSISLNGKHVPVERLGWNPAKWSDASLATHGSERAQDKTKLKVVRQAPSVPEKRSYHKPEFIEVSLESLGDHLQHNVRLQRVDAKVFEGLLTKVDERRYWLEIYRGGGIATVPVNKNDVATALVFK